MAGRSTAVKQCGVTGTGFGITRQLLCGCDKLTVRRGKRTNKGTFGRDYLERTTGKSDNRTVPFVQHMPEAMRFSVSSMLGERRPCLAYGEVVGFPGLSSRDLPSDFMWLPELRPPTDWTVPLTQQHFLKEYLSGPLYCPHSVYIYD